MIHIDRDPTLLTLLIQEALKARNLYAGECDNWNGPKTAAAVLAFQASMQTPPSRCITDDGIELVKHFEGCQHTAYQDEVGVWTIGYGHTGLKHNDGTVHRGRQITQEEAETLLEYDMMNFEARVSRLVTVPLNDAEFAALVSFDFNTGGLEGSTLLLLLNAGDRAGAADQFLRWNKAGGKVLAGLTRRRASERNLFLGIHPFIVP